MHPPDDDEPAVAPPPPPSPKAAARARRTRGFDTSPRRVGLELSAIALLVAGLGIGAFVAAGQLAAWLTPLVPLDVDRTLGSAAAQTMGAACDDPEAEAYVEKLAAPLLEAARPLPFEFEFRIADDPSINAYALPGGHVTVHRGLLEAAESGAEVAGVLGHEIQHALLRHGTRRILRQLGAYSVLALLTGGTELQGMSEAVGDLTALSYDREQELEADREGVALLVKAGIDPRGLSRFFERLRQQGPATPPALLSTHPAPEQRAQLVREAASGRQFRSLPAPPEVQCGTEGGGDSAGGSDW